jgi:hypothetical protein
MKKMQFSYIETKHQLFKTIYRPMVRLALFSNNYEKWVEIGNVLVDTGADVSIVPLPLGQILIPKIEQGVPMHIGGVLFSSKTVNAFLHNIKARIGTYSFQMPIAVSLSSVIPPILGRYEALDRFKLSLSYGKLIEFEIDSD